MRICFFGDSFVNGTGDDDALGWVGRVVSQARQQGHDITAYNLGIRRDTSANVAARWRHEAIARLPAECDGRLVFSFGANDCVSDAADGAPRVERAASLAHAKGILEAARRWRPTLMVGPGVVADDTAANARICELSEGYQALCARMGVPYLEMCRLLSGSATWVAEALAGDGAHPNRAGYRIVADAVSQWAAWRTWLVDEPARRIP